MSHTHVVKILNKQLGYALSSVDSVGSTFIGLSDTPNDYSGHGGKGVRVNAGATGLEFYTLVGGTDEKVGVDSVATPGYLGVASNDGVLRTSSPLTYVDGGDFVTLGVDETAIDHNQLANYSADRHFLKSDVVLGDLGNVVITSVADDEVLSYDSGSGDWINQTPNEAGLLGLDQSSAQTLSGGVPLMLITPSGVADIKSLVNKEYVDFAVTSLGAFYYMYDEDDATGYKVCYLDPSPDSEVYLDGADLSDDDYVGGWISALGNSPAKLLKGVYNWFITAEKMSGTKTLRLYWKLVERKSDSTEVEIGMSSNSNEISSKASYMVSLQLDDDYILGVGSRVVGKLYADVSGAGNAPTVRIYYQGNTSSRWEIPASSEVFKNIFVPYDGAVDDVDLGGKDLTTTGNVTADNLNISNWDSAYAHISSDGSSHTFIDQDVTVGGTPRFSKLGLGVGADANNPLYILHGGAYGIKLTSSTSDATLKQTRILLNHYTNAEEAVALFGGVSDSTHTELRFGGGYGVQNAATKLNFYTATDNTTTSGTVRMSIDSSGNVNISGLTASKPVFTDASKNLVSKTVDISDDTNLVAGTGIILTDDTLSTNDSEIMHDNLSGFVVNEHVDHSSVSINTTSPLSGGGDILSSRTISIGGLTSLGTANYVVGVNSSTSAWEYKQVEEGEGIDITHGAGSITLSCEAATTTNKGIASFNSANFSVSSGVVNTIQNINTSANPQFNRLGLGTAAANPDAITAVTGNNTGGIKVTNSLANSTTKECRFKINHYDTSEEDIAYFGIASTSTNTEVRFGGGYGVNNAANLIRFYAASDTTTLRGSTVMNITTNGNVVGGFIKASTEVRVVGDSGGEAGTVSMTASTTGVSTGSCVVKPNNTNTSVTNAGFLKFYSGTTAYGMAMWRWSDIT